jgi:hypothetical protein
VERCPGESQNRSGRGGKVKSLPEKFLQIFSKEYEFQISIVTANYKREEVLGPISIA